MKGTGRAGVAKFIMRGKEYNVFIRAYGNGIMIHSMYAETEVRDLPEYNSNRDDVEVSAQEVKLAKALLEAMSAPFDKTTLVDSYTVKVQALIDGKRDGAMPAGAPKTPRNDDDLLTALSASLYQAKSASAGAGTGTKTEEKKAGKREKAKV